MIRFLQSGNKAAKYILGGFLTILAVSMVTYLIPGFMNSVDANGRTGVVATVAGTDIRTTDATKIVQQQTRTQRVPDFYLPMLMQQAVQRLVQQQEMRYEAGRLGLKVYDSEVRDELQNGSFKQTFFPGGKWIGQKEYVDLLAQNNLTPEMFEAQVKDQVLARKLFGAISAGVSVTPAEVEQEYKDKNLKVKFKYAVLNLDDVKKEIKPTDADLKAFFNANQARYANSIPEKRQLRYFVLLDKDAESKATVTTADIQGFYNSNLNQYRLPERVKIRRILISTPPPGPDGKTDPKAVDQARAKATDVLKQLKAGGNFAELAKKYSQDTLTAQNGGAVGEWIEKGQFPSPEAEKAAFSQSKGQVSDLVQSPQGFDIIQTEDKELARVKPLAEVKDEIEKQLKAERVATILEQQATTVHETAQKQNLDKAAAVAGAQVLQSNPVGRNDSLPGVGASPELMTNVFATADKTPQIQRFPQGYVIYQVTGIDPPRTPSFEEIKDRVASDFKAQSAAQLLQKKTAALADRAHSEHDLEKAAKEAGATMKTSELVGRTSQVPEIGRLSGPAAVAFSLKPGEISGPINVGQKTVVLGVVDRQEASVADPQFAEASKTITEQLSEQKRQQSLELFMSNLNARLEKEGKLKYNKAEMDKLLKSGS
jgi:peptidyl-prolyl cis-trans isomerase D